MREPIPVNPFKIDWQKGKDGYTGTVSAFVKLKQEYTLAEAFELLEWMLREHEKEKNDEH